jgi:hypothetical protein
MWRRTWSSPSTTRMNCTSAEQRTQMARGTLHRAATIPRPPVHPAAGNPSRPSPRLKQARPAPGAGQPPGGRLDAGCGCARRRRRCAGRDLRPLGEIHLRLRHSSPPAASNRSAPSAQHRRQHRRNRWSPRTRLVVCSHRPSPSRIVMPSVGSGRYQLPTRPGKGRRGQRRRTRRGTNVSPSGKDPARPDAS